MPLSNLAECIRETTSDCEANGLAAPVLGHIGDGNFHVIFLLDPERPDELATIKAVNGRLIDRALAMGGTATGEHGVGAGKIRALEAEHGDAVEVMRSIKQALDPANLMNPGKIL